MITLELEDEAIPVLRRALRQYSHQSRDVARVSKKHGFIEVMQSSLAESDMNSTGRRSMRQVFLAAFAALATAAVCTVVGWLLWYALIGFMRYGNAPEFVIVAWTWLVTTAGVLATAVAGVLAWHEAGRL